LEGTRQDRLPQRLGALEIGLDRGLGFAGDGQQAVDFGDDAVLFGEGRQWHWKQTT
jgi:hypothetical protein